MEVERIHLDVIDSTNTYAKEHASEFDPKKITLITADIQTGGRGRFPNRSWISKRGNLHMSLVLSISPNPNLAQVLALSALEVVKLPIQIKWPNDLIFEDKKLAGVLVETTSTGAILGMGMNVNTPIETDQKTISLKELSGKPWDLNQLSLAIAKQFVRNADRDFGELPFEEHLAYKNEFITCDTGRGKIEGLLLGIGPDGHLQVEVDGKIQSIYSGDISHLRML